MQRTRLRGRAAAVAILTFAGALAGCPQDPGVCLEPTEAGQGGDSCSFEYSDVGAKSCYGGDIYAVECELAGEDYECECLFNGSVEGTCLNRNVCDWPDLNNRDAIVYIEECCDWRIYP